MTSNKQDIAKVIERIRKLHAMAEGAAAVGNEAEAEAFAEAVQKTLTANKLDASVLEAEEVEAVDPMKHEWFDFGTTVVGRKKRRIAWTERLAGHIARAHYVEVIVDSGGSNAIMFVGRTSDVQTAMYMLKMLTRIGKEGADKAYRKERYHMWKADKMDEAHGFRSAFLYGYVDRLGERLEELHETEVKSDARMGLIVVRAGEDIVKYKKDHLKTGKARGLGMNARGHSDALERGEAAGRRAADDANLGVRGVGADATKQRLDRAPKQLGRGDK